MVLRPWNNLECVHSFLTKGGTVPYFRLYVAGTMHAVNVLLLIFISTQQMQQNDPSDDDMKKQV